MRHFLEVLFAVGKLIALAGLFALGSCSTARTLLKQAPTDVPSYWIAPSHMPMTDAEAKAALQRYLYGRMDLTPTVNLASSANLSATVLEGRATLFQWRLSLDYGAAASDLDMVALLPNSHPDAPIILSQNFCPNSGVVPLEGVRKPDNIGFDCSGGGLAGWLITNIFGRYIVSPPLEDILDRGFGFAAIYPSQFIPDSAQSGLQTLDVLFPDTPNRPGALAAWASLFDVMAKTIEAEFGDRQMVAYGHSRFAKTALLAGAWFETIDAVVAHQSGTLGASALDDGRGEPLKAMVDAYPHWAGPNIAPYLETPQALPVRPAHLLALLNEKPVLLGNARRDVWSDPWGAFTEAKSAWGEAFDAQSPADFRPDSPKAYWLRPGTHGVVKEDWPAFLDFLEANLSPADK